MLILKYTLGGSKYWFPASKIIMSEWLHAMSEADSTITSSLFLKFKYRIKLHLIKLIILQIVRMSDYLDGIKPCKCKGKGHQFQRMLVFGLFWLLMIVERVEKED